MQSVQWKVRLTTSRHHNHTSSLITFVEIRWSLLRYLISRPSPPRLHHVLYMPSHDSNTYPTSTHGQCTEMSVHPGYVITTTHHQWWHSSFTSNPYVMIIEIDKWWWSFRYFFWQIAPLHRLLWVRWHLSRRWSSLVTCRELISTSEQSSSRQRTCGVARRVGRW